MSRTKNSSSNFVAGLVLTFVSLAVGVFSTPWLLNWLGHERFGAYRVLVDWGGYVGLFELGIGGALMARLAVAIGQGNEEEKLEVLAAGLRLYLRVTLLMVVVGFTWVAILPRLLVVTTISPAELRFTGAALLITLIATPLLTLRWLAEVMGIELCNYSS